MDGYIKDKQKTICSLRMTIFWKLFITFPLVLLLFVWIFGLCVMQPPAGWEEMDIIFHQFKYDNIGLRRWKEHILITEDGTEFVLSPNLMSIDRLKAQLIQGNKYRICYSTTFGVNDLRSISYNNETIIDRNVSESYFSEKQREIYIAIAVTALIELMALFLIDSLWCKTEHSQIKKQRMAILRRSNRVKK